MTMLNLVISLNVANVLLRLMLVDIGSSANIIFLATLREMRIENIKMDNVQVSLVGFSREQVSTVEPFVSQFTPRAST